jgi:Tfp pilus assembly protein PilX
MMTVHHVDRTGPRGWGDERGAALIIALMATLLLTALGVSLALLSSTESMITANHTSATEALYAADAGVERVVQDLLMVPRWDDILTGGLKSGFVDSTTAPTLPDGTTLNLATATTDLQNDTNTANTWGANNPLWRLYAYGRIDEMLPTGTINSNMYVVVWVGDDPSENDGDPQKDVNGVLTLRAEAFGPAGANKMIEVTVARTSSAEIERGYVAQRGQEELNQRSRKAAVQTPGKALTEMRMGVQSGGMTIQP